MKKWGGLVLLVMVAAWWNKPTPSKSEVAPARTVAAAAPVAKPAPIATPAPAVVPTPAASTVDRLYKTKECYESQTCAFPNNDPREYDFAVGRRLAELLREYRARPDADVTRVAKDFMAVEDGFVREEVLGILADAPATAENLEILADGLKLNADPALVTQALPVLEKYLGTSYEPALHALLSEMLAGPHYSAIATSTELGRFVNDASYAGYERQVTSMPAGSTVARNARSALRDYRLRQAGG